VKNAVPYIGFDNQTLDGLPSVEAGHVFVCPRCGETHELVAPDEGGDIILFYRCSDKFYLGAVSGKLVIATKPDVSGKLSL